MTGGLETRCTARRPYTIRQWPRVDLICISVDDESAARSEAP